MTSNNYITASEIGDYVYCKRAWWLKLNKSSQTTPAMIKGTSDHNFLSFQLGLSWRLKIIAILLIGIGFLTAVLVISYLF